MYVWWFIKYEILSERSNCFWPQWKTCLKVRECDLWPTSALSAGEHQIGRYRNETECEAWCSTRINKGFKEQDLLNFTWWCLKLKRISFSFFLKMSQCCYFSNYFLFLLEKTRFLLRTLLCKYMFVTFAWGGSCFLHTWCCSSLYFSLTGVIYSLYLLKHRLELRTRSDLTTEFF